MTKSRERVIAIAGVISVHAILLCAILFGLAPNLVAGVSDQVLEMSLLPLTLAVKPKPDEPVKIQVHKDAGASAKPALIAVATPVTAPRRALVPPPIAATAQPATSVSPRSGASTINAHGAGANGNSQGNGRGFGDAGDGAGDGDTPPRWLKGRITDSDYPSDAAEARVGGTVSVRYTVDVSGSVHHCAVTRSSGNASLDSTTCRLIEKRWRYAPSRDGSGRPVESEIDEDHEWVPHRDGDERSD